MAAVLEEVFSCAEIEPRVEFVDDVAVPVNPQKSKLRY